MDKLKDMLAQNELYLPQAPAPAGAYLATVIAGKYLYISGQLPVKHGEIVYKGQLGRNLSIEQGYEAAKLCALNILSQINTRLPVEKIRQIIKIEGFINCCESFDAHANVLNGASDLFAKILTNKAGHIRTVSGCNSLPLDAAVEISAVVEIN